jgi:hypothetical protein
MEYRNTTKKSAKAVAIAQKNDSLNDPRVNTPHLATRGELIVKFTGCYRPATQARDHFLLKGPFRSVEALGKELTVNITSALCITFILLAGPHPCVQAYFAQEPAEEILTNDSIVAMTRAGLSSDAIVNKIQSSRRKFDVSSDELIRLKQERVGDEVIKAMLDTSQEQASSVQPPRTRLRRVMPSSQPIPPSPPLGIDLGKTYESGIYFLDDQIAGQHEMIQLEPAVYTQSRSAGAWKTAVSRGILKTQYKAVLPGAHARLQVPISRPSFYFIFDVANSGLSTSANVWQGVTTSANEFLLVRLEAKKGSREIVVGQYGKYTGEESGTPDKYIHPFDYEKLSPGVYKITPKAALPPGEYCFFYGGAGISAGNGSGGGARVFDFRVTRER